MGVHDYTCAVCETPTTFECHEGEADGPDCKVTGVGEDEAILTFFFFPQSASPDSVEAFLDRHDEVLRTESFKFAYDWGAWEFKPSLAYRDLLMDAEDARGIWPLSRHSLSAESPVEMEVPDGERAWILNCCPGCWSRFVVGKEGAVCSSYDALVASHLGLGPDVVADEVLGRVPLPTGDVELRQPVRVERPEFHAAKEKESAEISRRVAEKMAAEDAARERAADPNAGADEARDEHGEFNERRPGGFQRF